MGSLIKQENFIKESHLRRYREVMVRGIGLEPTRRLNGVRT